MTEQEMQIFARLIARETIEEMKESKDMKCAFCSDLDGIARHTKSHEAFDKFMDTMNRIDRIKWGVLQAVAIAGVFAVLALVGLKLR